jgi:hypothetical protein
MKLKYLPINFTIKFSDFVHIDVNPLFIMRSMIGKNLRSMCCISKRSICAECMYNKTCAYAFLFETILLQENSLLPGTNRASHPFSITIKKLQREVQHEPFLALDGGDDGLDFYRAIVKNYTQALKPGGYLCFEFGMDQGDDVCRILEQNGYTILERSRDYNDRERAVLAQFGRKEEE